MHMSCFDKHSRRLSKKLEKKDNIFLFLSEVPVNILYTVLILAFSKHTGSSVGCFLEVTNFPFFIVWKWCIFYVGGRFFESLNLYLPQRLLVPNSICMVYCICSIRCSHVDIKTVACKTRRKVAFCDYVTRN